MFAASRGAVWSVPANTSRLTSGIRFRLVQFEGLEVLKHSRVYSLDALGTKDIRLKERLTYLKQNALNLYAIGK